MAKELKIEIGTALSKKKTFTFKNPKSGLTRANAETFVETLQDNNILNPEDPGFAGEIQKAYYEETIVTNLA